MCDPDRTLDCGRCDCVSSSRYNRHNYRTAERVTLRDDDGVIVSSYVIERCTGCGDER